VPIILIGTNQLAALFWRRCPTVGLRARAYRFAIALASLVLAFVRLQVQTAFEGRPLDLPDRQLSAGI